MTVLPGSLDYLYYNGILDHIPYEAYEMSPMTASGMAQMNGTQYLQAAQKGLLYDTYTYPDTFVQRNNADFKNGEGYSISQKAFKDGEGYGRDVDYEVMANGNDGKSVRQTITNSISKVKDSVVESPTWVKGILAAGIMLLTLRGVLKGKKPMKTKS